MSAAAPFDIAVVGGGPAGAVIAMKLVEYGFTVALVERRKGRGWTYAYSLPTATARLLDELGCWEPVERAGILHLDRTLRRWRGCEPETRHGDSFIIEPAVLSRTLRCEADRRGVSIFVPASVSSAERSPLGWILRLDPSLPTTAGCSLSARFLVDATGRRSRLSGRRLAYQPPTLAITACYEIDGGGAGAPAQRLEALREAWLWGAPLPGGGFVVTAFVAPAQVRKRLAESHEFRLVALLAASKHFRQCLEGQPRAAPQLCNATGEHAEVVAERDRLRIGDAALSLDPLSSQGILAALRGAIQGAAVVRTILARPHLADVALEFYQASVATAASQHRQVTGSLYGAVQRFAAAPFWEARAGAPDPVEPSSYAIPPLTASVRLASAAALDTTPVLNNGWIEMSAAVRAPGLDRPVAFINGVALAPLLLAAGTGCNVPDLLQGWARQLPWSQCQHLLGWLWRVGALEVRLNANDWLAHPPQKASLFHRPREPHA